MSSRRSGSSKHHRHSDRDRQTGSEPSSSRSQSGSSKHHRHSDRDRQTGSEPSSSRSQQQLGQVLNTANLARVGGQDFVRGPLEQLQQASRQVMNGIHKVYQDIDRLNTSIMSFQETAKSLDARIAAARSAGDWYWVQELGKQLEYTEQRIEQDEMEKQGLLGQLDQGRQSVNNTLHQLGLAVSGSANQPSYPAYVDLGEGSEEVPEQARPHTNF